MVEIPNAVKLGVVLVMLFAAVAVDFVSKVMSVGFDLFFISIAIWVALPMLNGKKDSK